MVVVWKTQKMVGKGKKTFLSNIGIVILTGFLLTGWLFATIAHTPIGRTDFNYYTEYCTTILHTTTELNGIITEHIHRAIATCSL